MVSRPRAHVNISSAKAVFGDARHYAIHADYITPLTRQRIGEFHNEVVDALPRLSVSSEPRRYRHCGRGSPEAPPRLLHG